MMTRITAKSTIPLLLALFFTLGGCDDLLSGGGHLGEYELVSVQGEPVPNNVWESGTLTLESDDTWNMYLRSSSGNTTASGTYEVSGSTVTFDDGTDTFTGTLDGSTLTVMEYVFERTSEI